MNHSCAGVVIHNQGQLEIKVRQNSNAEQETLLQGPLSSRHHVTFQSITLPKDHPKWFNIRVFAIVSVRHWSKHFNSLSRVV